MPTRQITISVQAAVRLLRGCAMRSVSYCLLATGALLATAAAGVTLSPAPAIPAPPTAAASTTWAAAAVNLGVVATPDAKTTAGASQGNAAAVKAGVEAWQKGNYSQAVAAWQPLAEKGDPDA